MSLSHFSIRYALFPLFIYHTLFELCHFSRYPAWENSYVKLCKMDRFRSFPCFRRAMDRPNIAEEVHPILRNVTYIEKISSKVTCLYVRENVATKQKCYQECLFNFLKNPPNALEFLILIPIINFNISNFHTF